MEKEKQGFRIDAGRPTAIISMLAFALSIPMQIIGNIDRLNKPIIAVALVFLPVLSALLMIVVIMKFGQKALWLTIFPIFIGVLGFAFKLMIDPRGETVMHHISAIVLYVAIVVLWALTVLYIIKTKWLLTLLFLIPFLKHIFVNDVPVLLSKAAPVSASTWFKEFSMLFFMLALTFCAVSFEN